MAAAVAAVRAAGLFYNHTGSVPRGLYRVDRLAPPTPGRLAVWCLPQPLTEEARRRHYVVRGACPSGDEPILKFVAAVAGDTVTVTSAGLHVNGRRLANSRPLPHDSHGRHIAAVPPGTYPVLAGDAWLWSPYTALSFDSRYYGPLPSSGFVGVASPVWTTHPPLPPAAADGHVPDLAVTRP